MKSAAIPTPLFARPARRAPRTRGLLPAGLAALLLGIVWCGAARAQLIDTVRDPYVTIDDSVNALVNHETGFEVLIVDPKILNRRGKPLVNGFDTYYLYIVKARDVRIEDAPLVNRQTDTYLACVSRHHKINTPPAAIRGKALILKGVIDHADSMIALYDRRLPESRAAADSMTRVYMATRYVSRAMEKSWNEALRRFNSDLYLREVYLEFAGAKRSPRRLVNFFASKLYNERGIQYSVISHPYGLPEIVFGPDEVAPKAPWYKRLWAKLFHRNRAPVDDSAPPPPGPDTDPIDDGGSQADDLLEEEEAPEDGAGDEE